MFSKLASDNQGVLTSSIVLTAIILPIPASAAIVNFEDGFVDLEAVTTINTTDGNKVNFSVGTNPSTAGPAFIAEVGDPVTAFSPFDGKKYEHMIGNFVLTDFNGTGSNPSFNYFIEFERPVTKFSITLLDYIESPNGDLNNVAVTAFSDLFNTSIGSHIKTISTVVNSTSADFNSWAYIPVYLGRLGGIRSVSIVGDQVDTGTAIDNISFYTEPVPEPLTILGSVTALGVGSLLKRQSSKKNKS